jgi:protoporphyrinogen/coproporphyrinogen III oxidase
MKKIYAVVGGGASGIAAAYFLRRQGQDVELIERDDELGGRISPALLAGERVQIGGRNIGNTYHLFREFCVAMGNNPLEKYAFSASRVENGKLVTMTRARLWNTLLEAITKYRPMDIFWLFTMAAAVNLREVNAYLGGPFFNWLAQRYDSKPLNEYFSKAFADQVLRVMSTTSNGAEPDEIYMGNYGSNLFAVFQKYERLSNGIAPLLEQFQRTCTVHLSTEVKSLIIRNGRVVGVRINNKDRVEDREYDGVIIATPASATMKLVQSTNPALARILGEVRYYPVMMMIAEYDRDIMPDGVRILSFSEDEAVANATVHSPKQRNIIRYTFSGRTSRRYQESMIDDAEMLRLGEQAMSRHFPIDKNMRLSFIVRKFPTGLCAYTPHYGEFADRLSSQLEQMPGLYLTGDYIQGVSIEACFRSSKQCVEHLLQSSSRPNSQPFQSVKAPV